MADRRRSERYIISLPVWLKDAHGGERTTTIDLSAHGTAVFSTVDRPLRQYIELEISLDDPPAQINVTAVVARHIDFDPGPEGTRGGLGLDFFLFDAHAKQMWHAYLQTLSRRTQDSAVDSGEPPVSAPPAVPEVPADAPPTFIIKPRDLGRLWAFYRGELSKGLVRIEAPVVKPRGLPVELLVVHPASASEWALRGSIARLEPRGRAGRPVLEIALDGVDAAAKARFRSFVATGRGMIEEDIDLEGERSDERVFMQPVASGALASRGLGSIERVSRDSARQLGLSESLLPELEAPDRADRTPLIHLSPPRDSEAPDRAETTLSAGPTVSTARPVHQTPQPASRGRRSIFSPFFEEAALGGLDEVGSFEGPIDLDDDLEDTLEPAEQELLAPQLLHELGEYEESGAPERRPFTSPSGPSVSPSARSAPPARERRVRSDNQQHRLLSTEAAHPELDREISLAQTRMARTPNSVAACYRLATLLLQRARANEWAEAEKALRSTLELEPNHPGAHHKWAELLARQGDYVRAAEHLSRARRLGYQVDPDLARLLKEVQEDSDLSPSS